MGSQIRDSEFKPLSFGVEAEEAADMVLHTVKNCFTLIRGIKHLNLGEILRCLPVVASGAELKRLKRAIRLGDIPSVWLAAQFGWLPLVADVSDALDMFDHFAKKRQNAEMVFKTKAKRFGADCTATATYAGDYPPVQCTYVESCAVAVKLTVAPSMAYQAHASTIADFSAAVLEAIPFSWLGEYFYPIGRYLEACSTFGGLDDAAGKACVTWVTEYTVPRYVPGWVVGFEVKRDLGGWHEGKFTFLERHAPTLQSIAIPKPSFKRLAEAMSNAHIKNLGAVISQMALGLSKELRDFR